MMQTAEKILESVRALPKVERKKVFELIEAEKYKDQDQSLDLRRQNEKFQSALQWIEKHKEEFDGKFVVLDGDKLIAHGTDSKTVYDEARAKGYKSPFLKRVKAKTLPFGGW